MIFHFPFNLSVQASVTAAGCVQVYRREMHLCYLLRRELCMHKRGMNQHEGALLNAPLNLHRAHGMHDDVRTNAPLSFFSLNFFKLDAIYAFVWTNASAYSLRCCCNTLHEDVLQSSKVSSTQISCAAEQLKMLLNSALVIRLPSSTICQRCRDAAAVHKRRRRRVFKYLTIKARHVIGADCTYRTFQSICATQCP